MSHTPQWKHPSLSLHRIYKIYVKNSKRPEDWRNVKVVRNATIRKIEKAKEDYFTGLGQRLSDPSKGQKAC